MRLNQKGLGLIEYIFILILTLTLILGIVYQFNVAFRDFAENYFGEYLRCLLETGELPTIGATGNTNISECNSSFAPFSWSSGRPALANSNLNSNSAKSSNQSSKNNSSSNNKKNSTSRATKGGGGGNVNGGGSSGNSNLSLNRKATAVNAGSGKTGDDKKDMDGKGDSSGSNSGGIYGPAYEVRKGKKRGGIVAQEFQAYADDIKKKEKEGPVQAKIVGKEEGNTSLKKKAIPMSLKKKKVNVENEQEKWSIGKLIRILIIVLIIIMIVIFIGGQMLQISKSWEK